MFGTRRKPVSVVLGAGPAGLLAAHAAERRGWEVNVFSAPGKDGTPQKSELHGCQYLHAAIPGVTMDGNGPQHKVRYLLNGTPDQYRRKVYGNGWTGQVSPDEYGPEADHYAWDLRKAYDLLWDRWAHRIAPLTITPALAARTATVKGQTVFCTVPARSLCLKPEDHKFVTQSIWAMGSQVHLNVDPDHGAPPGFVGSNMPYRSPDMTVQCNGEDAPRWYRAATVFGHSTIEWPAGPKPPISGVVAVEKPLSTDCDCHLQGGRWHRLGRYGRWAKGVLVHETYFEAMALR